MTVFVVNSPTEISAETGESRTKFDISGALQYGSITHLLPPGPFHVSPASLTLIREGLVDYDDQDFLLLIGHPVAIAAASAIAARQNSGRVQFLRWSGVTHRYHPVAVRLWEPTPVELSARIY